MKDSRPYLLDCLLSRGRVQQDALKAQTPSRYFQLSLTMLALDMSIRDTFKEPEWSN